MTQIEAASTTVTQYIVNTIMSQRHIANIRVSSRANMETRL